MTTIAITTKIKSFNSKSIYLKLRLGLATFNTLQLNKKGSKFNSIISKTTFPNSSTLRVPSAYLWEAEGAQRVLGRVQKKKRTPVAFIITQFEFSAKASILSRRKLFLWLTRLQTDSFTQWPCAQQLSGDFHFLQFLNQRCPVELQQACGH